jgi:hypothetical protein
MSDATVAPTTTARRAQPSIRSLSAGSWGLVGLFGCLFVLGIAPAADPDLGWHLGAGRWIIENKRIPLTDPFSWSVPGRKWIAHEWLTEVIMQSLRTLAGDWVLILLWAAMISASWAIVYRTARRLGASRIAGAVFTGVGAISALHTWGVRPQMLTLFLAVIAGTRLQTWRMTHGRTPWELVPLTIAWANLHGGYIFGIVMVLVFAVGALSERIVSRWPVSRGRFEVATNRNIAEIWLLFIGCVLASLCTPNTIDGLIYPFTYLGDNASTRYVGEWFAPDFTRLQFWPFGMLVIATVVLLVIGVKKRFIGLTELGLVVPFALMGLQSLRNITQFALCGVPVIASIFTLYRSTRSTGSTSARAERRAERSNRPGQMTARQHAAITAVMASTSVLVLLITTVSDLTPDRNREARQELVPVAATEWLLANPGGNIFNHYNYGGYLILNNIPVYVDGRPDMYGDAFVDDYVALTIKRTNNDWQADVARIGAERILMPKGSVLGDLIAKDIKAGKAPDWYEPTTDPIARLFVKR